MKAYHSNSAETFTNRVLVNNKEFDKTVKHVNIKVGQNDPLPFTIKPTSEVELNTITFDIPKPQWIDLDLSRGLTIDVTPYDDKNRYVSQIILEVDFLYKTETTTENYVANKMQRQFASAFHDQVFFVDQIVTLKHANQSFKLVVKEMKQLLLSCDTSGTEQQTLEDCKVGIVNQNTVVSMQKADSSSMNLVTTDSIGTLFHPKMDFRSVGIGGLDKEFDELNRRVFASRRIVLENAEESSLKHVRGILLYGPPGTGKSLIAKKIGMMLHTTDPKIVSGPEILDKFIGGSEGNIRNLFADAERDFNNLGNASPLHIIIFDEIDAICKARGSIAGSAGVNDSVVNQLLAKMDGVQKLDNILVIGMTNRKDMIDDALLRPGRFEVQLEIGLPDKEARLQILEIHTKNMKLDESVNLDEIARDTQNFSGAEIEGLVKSAQSYAIKRSTNDNQTDLEIQQKLVYQHDDFINGKNEITPALGSHTDTIRPLKRGGIIYWGAPVKSIVEDGELFVNQARNSSTGLVTILLEGPPNSGKTALASHFALESGFPFIRICSPENMVAFTDTAKCNRINKEFDDAYKSPLSCLIVDNIERLIDYNEMGPRFSNMILQTLLVVLKKQPPEERKLLILCTTSCKKLLADMEVLTTFTAILPVPNLTEPEHLNNVLQHVCDLETSKPNNAVNIAKCFTAEERNKIARIIQGKRIQVGIKKLLALVDMSREMESDYRVAKFLAKLEDENCLEMKAY
ncbi:vesicle-fusing ATPase 2-like protein [Leptotrombidium deliense]|uniref:Vesicle-fusing ATPase n=1 Tax=Leptotrombidium deliense TaxID=299467 RepID=A0A443S9U0_9ACAR|nr:vesicle-fusing ATPase 2-like protein [Leptotrombidium deliense]